MRYDETVKHVAEVMEQYTIALTLRQIYYRLVAKYGLPNTRSNYNSLSKILVKARELDEIDETKIEDRTRTTIGGDFGYFNPKDFVERQINELLNSPELYSRRLWENQENYIEVWVEKDALSKVISAITNKYNVLTAPSKGYGSYSYLKEATQRFPDKPVTVLHFSDHDPSGIDMTRDLRTRLIKYSNRQDIVVKRIALTHEQVQERSLPPNPTKTADPRSQMYIKQYGGECWELDAIEPDELQEIVQTEVEKFIHRKTWNKTLKLIKEERKKLRKKFGREQNKIKRIFGL